MAEKIIHTNFLPAERSTNEEIKRQSEIFSGNNALVKLVESLSQMLIVLNRHRQIVYANKLYCDYCEAENVNALIGKRPGEALNCIHAFTEEGGCGTTEFCRKCGAANAILDSHSNIHSTKECRISTHANDFLELEVTASPYDLNGENFTIFTIIDISDKKRRESLERVFFHDILNSAGGISGLSTVLQEAKDQEEVTEIAEIISRAAENLVEEIQMQRELSAAERGELKPEIKEINSLNILNVLKDVYARHELITDKAITIRDDSKSVLFNSDAVLVRRIIGNMIKNALEVYNPKGEITIACVPVNKGVRFSVHNTKYMERNIQLQLFKRSFSTKGMGRGLGTYSMKLLGEKYLGGKVWFESTPEEGTTFFLEL